MSALETVVTRGWLAETLREDGYDVSLPDDSAAVLGIHVSRPNVLCLVRDDCGIVEFISFWAARPDPGTTERLRAAVNDANTMSPFETYYVDETGNLRVSSYIVVPERGLTGGDVRAFLERTAASFWMIVNAVGLQDVLA